MWTLMLAWTLTTAAAQEAPAADPPSSQAPTESDQARAKEIYDNGAALYNEAEYAQAIAAFEEAYRLSGRHKLLFNIANAYERWGKLDDAREALTKYRVYATAEERDSLERRLNALDERIRKEAAVAEAEAQAQAAAEAEAVRQATERAAAEAASAPVVVERPNGAKYALLGSGLAVAAGSGVVAGVTFGAGQSHRQAGDQASYESVRPLNLASLGGVGVGTALAVVGLVLPAKKTVTVSAAVRGDTPIATLSGRF